MADIVNYMGISDVIVSCGTCYEMLSKYTIENIFQDAEITDINEFIATHLLYSKEENSTLYYHDPCHSPLKKMGADKTFKTILGTKPLVAPNCCGEGGTLALSTPHISNSLRNRKRKNIKELLTKRENITVLTTCPSCVQGLSRINGRTSVTGKSMVVYLAEKMLGTGWKKQLVNELKKQGVERIIL
jgi:Fe-S oxidoreductase